MRLNSVGEMHSYGAGTISHVTPKKPGPYQQKYQYGNKYFLLSKKSINFLFNRIRFNGYGAD